MNGTILLIASEKAILTFCGKLIEKNSKIVLCSSLSEAEHPIGGVFDIGLVLLDFNFICLYGYSVVKKIVSLYFGIPVIVISEEASSIFSVRALQYGATDYIVIPCAEDVFYNKCFRYIKQISPVCTELLGIDEESKAILSTFIGESKKAIEFKQKLYMFAQTIINEPILLLGESGSGKSLAANIIHKLSKRRENLFIQENISVIPETLAEGTLFGTVKGAYTGAENAIGLFEKAEKGTLFLDEIGEASFSIQTKLLKVIEEKTFHRVGSLNEKIADVQLITATNGNLFDLVKLHKFREDLLYRLAVLSITVPPLRERKEDIPLIIDKVSSEFNVSLSVGAMQKLKDHKWPGNVRELLNCLHRAICVCSKKTIIESDILFLPISQE